MKGCQIEGQEPKGSRIVGQELKSLHKIFIRKFHQVKSNCHFHISAIQVLIFIVPSTF
jgi:hypothetical protein